MNITDCPKKPLWMRIRHHNFWYRLKKPFRNFIDRYWHKETCPYYYGKGTCEGSRSCGYLGEPVCVTSPKHKKW